MNLVNNPPLTNGKFIPKKGSPTKVKVAVKPVTKVKKAVKKVLPKKAHPKYPNKKIYSKEYKELKFLVDTKKADDFTIEMYVAMVTGRKITEKMLNAIRNIIKRNKPSEVEKKRLETERLLFKLNLVKEALHKANYHDTYVWRSEDFLDSIEGQIRKWGNLSSKQKLALNKMYIRFNKRIEKST
jgi:hypothetical protein